jgi:hypothetical protein
MLSIKRQWNFRITWLSLVTVIIMIRVGWSWVPRHCRLLYRPCWQDGDRGVPNIGGMMISKYSEESVPVSKFVHDKSHRDSPGIELWFPRCEAGDKLSELRHGHCYMHRQKNRFGNITYLYRKKVAAQIWRAQWRYWLTVIIQDSRQLF